MERSLVSKMVMSRESLEAICQLLIIGKPIRHHSVNNWVDLKKTALKTADGGAAFNSIEKRVVREPRQYTSTPSKSPMRRPTSSRGSASPMGRKG